MTDTLTLYRTYAKMSKTSRPMYTTVIEQKRITELERRCFERRRADILRQIDDHATQKGERTK